MRTLILMAWLLVPLAAVAYHYGPGQRQLCVDDVGRLLKQAEALAEAGRQPEAVAAYRQALDLMPDELVPQQRRARLEMARLQMTSQMLPEAYLELIALVDELREDPDPDPKFTRDAEAALANARYYLTWLLRLEGAPRDVWEPEIEAARQTFRELAEDAEKERDGAENGVASASTEGTTEVTYTVDVSSTAKSDENDSARRYREDLEATIRLARMDLDELQGLSLPCQCRGCCSGDCKGNKKSKCKKKGKGKGGEEKKDARGASSGPPPDNTGS